MGMQMSYHLDGFLLVGGGMEVQLCGDTVWWLPKTAPAVDELSLGLAFSLAGGRQESKSEDRSASHHGQVNKSANSSGYLALGASLSGGQTPALARLQRGKNIDSVFCTLTPGNSALDLLSGIQRKG